MWPLPSAVKLPARVKGVLNPPHSSVPLIKKAYCPFKLALEKVPAGRGGGGPTTAGPAVPSAQKENSKIAANDNNPLLQAFTSRHPDVTSYAKPKRAPLIPAAAFP